MIGRRLVGIIALFVLFLSAAGCGSDTLTVTLSWSSGDMDIAIQGPLGTVYTTKDGATLSGYFSADDTDGGVETFTLWPYLHGSGEYNIGYECFDGGSHFYLTINRNGHEEHFEEDVYSPGLEWVYVCDIRSLDRP